MGYKTNILKDESILLFRFPALKKNLDIYRLALEEFTLDIDKNLRGKKEIEKKQIWTSRCFPNLE